MRQQTLFGKLWEAHVVRRFDDGRVLVHVDRHMVQEGTSAEAFAALRQAGRGVRRPDLTWAVMDHVISTAPGRSIASFAPGSERLRLLQRNCADFGIPLFDLGHPRQGIAHVVAPELGLVLPGATLVCGDSHTATSGGLGALAWGIGTTEVRQVLAAQCLLMREPRTMRVTFSGTPGPGVAPKDLVLALIRKYGVSGGTGHAIEYAGSAVRALGIEARMTICNMSIEFGARFGFVGVDDTTIEYLSQRPLQPRGRAWDEALASWRTLHSDAKARFDAECEVDCTGLAPQVSWGSSPQSVIGIGERVPDPSAPPAHHSAVGVRDALRYMGLQAGQPIEGLPIDIAFIGSCTNSRLSDLEQAARVVQGRRVATGVRALVVPGSTAVQRAAEAAGLDRIFLAAGFEWRAAGCSMCVAANEDVVPPGRRCISTSNRNFENRQGPGARTHLASPVSVAAAAVQGCITDPRKFLPPPA